MSAKTGTVLDRILEQTRLEVERRKREQPLGAGPGIDREPDGGSRRHFHDALGRPGIGVIAEFKRRSPAAGQLRERPDLPGILNAYTQGGASAISILTDGPHFEGSLEDLRHARAACDLPLLRKDFILDPYQLHEALAAGADAVLLIAAALDQATLASLHRHARNLELDVLVEVHDREELDRALDLGADLIGINNRDLRDFSVDVGRTERLMTHIPAGVSVISESGISTHEQLEDLANQGLAGVLVGEALMRADDPRGALEALRGV